jgi:hypothetical protein
MAVAALGALILAVYFALRPHPARSDFEAASSALQQVPGWRYTETTKGFAPGVLTLSEETTRTVRCPDSQHVAQKKRGRLDGRPITEDNQILHHQGITYLLQLDGSWKRWANAFDPSADCLSLASGADTVGFPPFSKYLTLGHWSGGEKKTLPNGVCRQWTVTFTEPGKYPAHHVVCIGVTDHLPYALAIRGGPEIQYGDWKAPIEIPSP